MCSILVCFGCRMNWRSGLKIPEFGHNLGFLAVLIFNFSKICEKVILDICGEKGSDSIQFFNKYVQNNITTRFYKFLKNGKTIPQKSEIMTKFRKFESFWVWELIYMYMYVKVKIVPVLHSKSSIVLHSFPSYCNLPFSRAGCLSQVLTKTQHQQISPGFLGLRAIGMTTRSPE